MRPGSENRRSSCEWGSRCCCATCPHPVPTSRLVLNGISSDIKTQQICIYIVVFLYAFGCVVSQHYIDIQQINSNKCCYIDNCAV